MNRRIAAVRAVRRLREDAAARGWVSEVARHQRVIDSLEKHLHRLKNTPGPPTRRLTGTPRPVKRAIGPIRSRVGGGDPDELDLRVSPGSRR